MFGVFRIICKVIVFLAWAVPVSCASSGKAPKDTAFEKELFSSSKYIAQHGYGNSIASAKDNALAQISRYFYQAITVKSEEHVQVSDSGSTTSVLDEETFVQTQTELFAVHYLEAVQDKNGKWQCVAYIDRDEAWQIYEPQLERAAGQFSELCRLAEKEGEPLKKALHYANAQKAAAQNDLAAKLSFAAILYPASTTLYMEASERLATIDAARIRAVSLCPVFASCEPENATLLGGLEAALSSGGFAVVKTEQDGKYVCRMKVQENEQVLKAGTFYTPQVEVMFLRDGQAVAAYAFLAKRAGATDANVARLRAYNAVVAELKSALLENLAAISTR